MSSKDFLDLHVIRYLRQKPQLLLSLAAALTVLAACHVFTPVNDLTAALVAWNSFTCLYIAIALVHMLRASYATLESRAHLYDDGEGVILILSLVAAGLSFAAIAGELATSAGLPPAVKAWHIALSGVTLLSSWTFIHLAFAFHYAHGYYSGLARPKPVAGLIFPGKEQPHYSDFLYFAFVIGTSGQTADVAFATREMRRIGTVHCVAAFLFNATVLALTINIAASLIAK
ncbi:DUF1345 domain-containing protein [Asticcacaulis sp. AC402]|uniref:DUF1345 domain-containing protein n=1 Tax=Asticcacaulis sp. AC402 TaxID=1282361 RepID=UPI0003C40941|nr:DUF1345 domain-containing protein [Asticcacaulis sp. AC402]ESQ77204.1 hypothetical protein ABAC402_02030 [Asticcacaulis sp. AC402]